MGSHDVPVLFRFSFYNKFHKNCGRSESLMTTTCPRSVVGGKQGFAPYEIPLHQQSLYFVSAVFHGDNKTVIMLR